ncbi:hypothetical protein P3T21_000076 [Paraburkholderia sp. GAS334]
MSNQLKDAGALRASLEAVHACPAKSATNWYADLEAFLSEVQEAESSKLSDKSFFRRLWDDNPVSAVGNGTVKISPALENEAFVECFAGRASAALPADPLEAEATHVEIADHAHMVRRTSMGSLSMACSLISSEPLCLIQRGVRLGHQFSDAHARAARRSGQPHANGHYSAAARGMRNGQCFD